jgi:hypothetical protein
MHMRQQYRVQVEEETNETTCEQHSSIRITSSSNSISTTQNVTREKTQLLGYPTPPSCFCTLPLSKIY